jgi:hypothetical protein
MQSFGSAFFAAFRLWECGLHTLIHTYEKAGCQVKKLYQLPT